MAKFIKTNSSGKIEICIKKNNHDSQNSIRKYQQSRYIKELAPEPWVKVVFNDGANFDHDWIRQELQNAASGPNNHKECILKIFNYRVSEESAILFIKLTDVSYSSFKHNCSKIPHPHTGQPCDVVVMSIENPETPSTIPERWIESLKEALSLRYNSSTKSLNLSNFTEDSYLNNLGLWLSLSRPAIVKAISNLLQSIDNLILNNLDLSNNNINFSTHLIPLFEAVPIHHLDMSDNCLILKALFRSLQFATYLNSLVILNDRGVCGQKMKYQSDFLAELTENCPSLERFNNENLKSDIPGGIGTLRLPVSKRSTSESDHLLLNFFMEHAQKIETNRDDLIDYYSSDSILTLSACYHDMSMNNRRLNEVYLRNSRNLDRLKDEGRRSQLIKRGSAQILGLISEIPRLKHITESFIIDTIVNNDQSKMFVVNGLFVECLKIPNRSNNYENRDENNGSTHHNVFNVRMFSRVMIVVAPGKILQENWTITNPTDYLFRKYREKFEEIRNNFDMEKVVKSEETQKSNLNLIVENFCQFSRMNRQYSEQCLQESNWDVNKAKEIFKLAYDGGKIPKEAFQS